jgi:hypothetical protein
MLFAFRRVVLIAVGRLRRPLVALSAVRVCIDTSSPAFVFFPFSAAS